MEEWTQLVGFHVTDNTDDAPTFQTYLAPSAAHEGADIYKLSGGSWSNVTTPGTEKIRGGEGYWVTAQHASEYSGPIDIDDPSLRGVDYAVSLSEHTIELENIAADTGDVTLSYLPSAAVPPSPDGLPTLAGDVPLRWYDYGEAASPDNPPQWRPFSTETWPLAQAGELGCNLNLRLAFSRMGLEPALLDAEGGGSQYQGLLKVTDGRGFERYLGRSRPSETCLQACGLGLSLSTKPTGPRHHRRRAATQRVCDRLPRSSCLRSSFMTTARAPSMP